MRRASERARAKINLTLRVLGKRPDGFHELSSLAAFADISDVIETTLVEAPGFSVTGPFSDALSGSDNLVMRAVAAVAKVWPGARDYDIKLYKQLPVAAGLGGGSADAAAILRLLNRVSPNALAGDEIEGLAASLGSDVPVCMASRAAVMRGRGERVNIVPEFPALPAVLVNPGITLDTAGVYEALGAAPLKTDENDDAVSALPVFATAQDVIDYMEGVGNDLQNPATKIAPVIDDVLSSINSMPGCLIARMSGSGATCFGIFQSGTSADAAALTLAGHYPEWWVRKSILS